MFERPQHGERALIVHLKLRDPRLTAEVGEFKELAKSAGAEVIDIVICPRQHLAPKFLIGQGKITEIAELVAEQKIDLILFNYTLSPAQERNLERALCCRVLDRAGLILDIFAQRARTFEGKLQVELAQLQHLSTRLIRGWTHLERQKGGIGLRGPGETQLEMDRRMLRARIKHIQQRLQKVKSQRQQSRRSRQKAQVPTIALVGYTNTGKSTLFNVLTKQQIYAADQLFATLDPTLRTISLPHIGKGILADTVGFIRDLPHQLIEAFQATLEETVDADLLLHVIDGSDPLAQAHKTQVEGVLHEIGAAAVPRLEVLNKIDKLTGVVPGIERDLQGIVERVRISAANAQGLDVLVRAISERLGSDIVSGQLTLEPAQAKIRARLYDHGAVDLETVADNGAFILAITLQLQRWTALCHDHPELEASFQQVPLRPSETVTLTQESLLTPDGEDAEKLQ